MNKIKAMIVILGVSAFSSWAGLLPDARLTVKVVNEDGQALTGMVVTVGFSEESHRGYSNSNGLFTATGKERFGDPGYGCTNMGYYPSHLQYKYSSGDTSSNRWLPWDPVVTMMVRRIVNPMPMFAKRVETQIPVLDEKAGYDLMIGDWMAPYGKGQKADFIFMKKNEPIKAFNDFSANMDLSFSNPKDGFEKCEQPNPFKGAGYTWRYSVPEDGYAITNIHLEIGYLPANGFYQKNNHEVSGCYFRIRSVTNELGQVVQAYYGKMPGFVVFEPRGKKTASIHFTYYLNPTPNDRNVEFDPKKNLFKDLKSTEQVSAP